MEGQSELLAKLLSKSDELIKFLVQMFQDYRLEYKRFFFISDEALVELISSSKNVALLSKHINKIFSGIETLGFTPSNS